MVKGGRESAPTLYPNGHTLGTKEVRLLFHSLLMKFCPPLAVNATFVTLTKCKLLLKKMWLKRPYLSNFARFCTKMHVGNLHKILSTHQCEWPVFKRTLPITLQEISQLDILCNTKQTQKKINNWWPAAIYWNKTSRNKCKEVSGLTSL